MVDEPEQMMFHAKMYEIGEKYVVGGLKELAREKFKRSCDSHWDTPHFAAAVRYVFSSTAEDDTGLRNITIKTISTHINVLNKPEINALLNEFNDLAVGLLEGNAALLRWDRASA
ncbi:hypothetical protein E8E13_011606 [Curvularia kusanoi]|uniref:Uncharacterized protein n=1 Tax=Curvularia kusanoi TaxID=90978 RepID=A0A9P4TN80_CURKU|nr:hypothetical protein E8E13_011606 [Curvularia kusanoi]